MKRFAIMLFLVFAACDSVSADEPEYFRGDSGFTKSTAGLPTKFDDKEQLWKTPLPAGISTPCVMGDLVLATSFNNKTKMLATHAINRKTGKIRWTRSAPTKNIEQTHRVGSPASASPACNGKQIFSFFGSYGLLCYDLQGTLLWSKPMGPFQDEFGASSSPVLADGLVILNEDHDIDCHVIALNQKDGSIAWRTPRPGFTRSYSTPVIWDSGKGKQVIVAGALQLAAYDLKNGKKLWWVDGLSRIVDSTPVVANNMIYVATWTPGGDTQNRISMEPYPLALKRYDKNSDGKVGKSELPPGAVLTRFYRIDLDQDQKLDEQEWNAHSRVFRLAQNVAMAVRPGGKGNVTKDRVKWVSRVGLPTVPSPLSFQGVLYMVKDGGIVTTLDAAGGKTLNARPSARRRRVLRFSSRRRRQSLPGKRRRSHYRSQSWGRMASPQLAQI